MNGLNRERPRNKDVEEHWCYDYKTCAVHSFAHHMNSAPFPQELGQGFVKQLLDCPFVQIKDSEFTLYDTMCGGANFNMPRIVLYFCLSGEFVLDEQELMVDTANFLAFNATDLRHVIFQPNISHRVITVELYPHKIRNFGGDALHTALQRFQTDNIDFSTHKISATMKTLLHQMVNCPYHESVRGLYMEGKLLEFLAVYVNEMIYEQETPTRNYSSLSRQDIKSIYEAKNFLDQSFVAPPTLAALSKKICLNEFKLKKGFKELFGQTVHTYIVDKRLELAKQLFEEKHLNVGEAASHIGYANASYFALAFRKKFGVSPSEYLGQKQ